MILGLVFLGITTGFSCPSGIGAIAGEAPKQVYKLPGAPELALCGWQTDKDVDGNPLFTEFELVNIQTRDVFLRVDAVQEFTAEITDGRLVLTEYKNYPVNPEYDWEHRSYRQLEVRANEEGNHTCLQRVVFKPPVFSEQDRLILLEQYEMALQAGRHREGLAELIVQAAMSGDERFVSLLPELRTKLHLDGHLLEEFFDVRRLYNELHGNRETKPCNS